MSLLSFICFTSCDTNAVFDEVQSTGGQWLKEDVKTFTFDAKDTLTYHNIYINLRADHKYPYSNVFIIVKTFQPDGKGTADTLQYEMAKSDGEMLGNGITDLKESALWFKSKHRFKMIGSYKYEIEHAVRKAAAEAGDGSLDGINDVGLRIEKAQ